ncbi:MAG: hypothetical protein GC162_00365 [Planctomycetes bacterium]|nr:hypothetical protein [Planctomycetota bacterium]
MTLDRNSSFMCPTDRGPSLGSKRIISRRRAIQYLGWCLAPACGVVTPSIARADEVSFNCETPGKGWLRVAYAISEVNDYHEFTLSVWSRYRAYGEDAERNVLNLGPIRRGTRGATNPMKIAPTTLRIGIAGVGFQYRVQVQFKPEDGNDYKVIGEQTGTF